MVGNDGGMTSATRLVDQALDRTVVAGYTWPGYRLRRHWWPADPAPDALEGRTVLVTGGTSGIGLTMAADLAQLGAQVHVLGHSERRGAEALDTLRRQVPQGRFDYEYADLQSLAAVRDFCTGFAERVGELHALVHNAGLMSPEREETVDGHERSFAVHVVAPHLMNHLLAPRLAATSRIVIMSSGGMYAQRLTDDYEYHDDGYSAVGAYARTKRMQVVLAQEWAQRLAERGVAVHGMHPGWVDTPGVRTHLPKFRALTRPLLRSPEQGADTAVWLVATPRVDPWTGGFWQDRAPRPVHYRRGTVESAEDRADLMRYLDEATATYAATP